jgi:hypothetical protein
MSTRAHLKKILSSVLSGFLVLLFFLTPVSHTFEVKKAEAIPVVVTSGFGTLQETFTAIATGASELFDLAMKNKEFVLDGIAWSLANAVLKEMIKSMTKWVNSGFEGKPTFVTDLNGTLVKAADQAAGNFIWGNKELKFLCSPFSLDIKLALDLQYREARNYEAQCTLSDVVGNMNNFFSGDFLEGGWDGWYKVTQTPQNNPYGAMLEAQSALTLKISGAQSKELKLLDFGKGFFSMKDPRCKPDPANPDDFDESRCKLVTPGTAIESQLNTSLAGGLGRIQVADELNELIGALFSQLVTSVFSSAGGLLGSTDSDGDGGSIFDRVGEEPDPTDPDFGSTSFDDILEKERKFLDFLTEAFDLVTSASTYWRDTYSSDDRDPRTASEEQCYEAGVLPASLAQTLEETTWEFTTASSTIAGLEELRADLMVLNDPGSPPAVVSALRTKYNASTTPAAKSNIMKELNSYISSGVLHSSRDLGLFEAETLPRIEDEVTAFIESVDNACRGGGGGGG